MTAFTAVFHPNYQNLQKVGYDIVIFNGNGQCTRSCVTYMMQNGYQWKEDELLFTYRPHANVQINWLYNNGPLNMDYLFFLIRTVYQSLPHCHNNDSHCYPIFSEILIIHPYSVICWVRKTVISISAQFFNQQQQKYTYALFHDDFIQVVQHNSTRMHIQNINE